jgi:X-Pro dipeptidyl-peptidase
MYMSDRQRRDVGGSGGGTEDAATALSRRRLLASVTASAVGSSALAGCSLAGLGGGGATPDAYDRTDVVREEAWVETPVDTDDDGAADRVFVRVARPASDDDPVPVIGSASPYNGEQTHSDATEAMFYERSVAPAADDEGGDTTAGTDGAAAGALGSRARPGPNHAPSPSGALSTPHQLGRRYVPEGYAVASLSSLGTHRSTGCYTAAGPETIDALEAVVDWFNGRATAYDAPEDGAEVTADWTEGATGLVGASALGELANGVAARGVDGLEAIVPQAANVGQYGLFRSNGTPVSVTPDASEEIADLGTWVQAGNALREDCARWTDIVENGQDLATGDYNDFWHERTFLTGADAVDCAVLLAHSVDDPIVTPNNAADWYETLAARDVPLKLWLVEGGHTGPHGEAWADLLDRWWAHWLKGEDTGVMDEDPVTVVHGGRSVERGEAETYAEWPVPGTERATVRFAAGGSTAGGVTVGDAEAGTESFTDDPSTLAEDLAAAEESSRRLRYETAPFAESVHVSGRVVPSLWLSFDEPTVVSVALVEYTDAGADVVTRGWADPLNRPRYDDHDTPLSYRQSLRESAPVESGERVRVEFPLQATDHVFDAGSRLGLVVYGSDREFTFHVPDDREVTLSLGESSVGLPIVGGESALTDAVGDVGDLARRAPTG